MQTPETNPDTPYVPNLLKRTLIDYANGLTDMKVFMYALLKSQIAIPSETAPQDNMATFKPLILDRQGTPMVSIFTDIQLARPFTDSHPYVLTTDARWFLSQLAPGVGITIDPGQDKPFELMPAVIPAVISYFADKLDQPPKQGPDGPAIPQLTDPENSLELALLACSDNVITLDTLLACLIRSPIYIASATPVDHNGQGLAPKIFDRRGIPMMSAHSSLNRAQQHHPDAPFAKPFPASAVIQNFPPGHGIVLNLGYAQMLELLPDHIAAIKQQLAAV